MSTRRDVVATHYRGQEFLSCPVCQCAINLDHDEAIRMEALAAPPVEVVEVLDVDFVMMPLWGREGGSDA